MSTMRTPDAFQLSRARWGERETEKTGRSVTYILASDLSSGRKAVVVSNAEPGRIQAMPRVPSIPAGGGPFIPGDKVAVA